MYKRQAYTLTVKNDDTATVPVENGVITDVLPVGLTFEYGSVTLNGKNTNDYTYDENTRLLTVNVGTIKPVSYTHLDVYKRQVSRRSLLSAAVWAARSHIRRQRSCTKWALRLT